MLEKLHEVEKILTKLLWEPEKWESVDITYEPPRVERLWTPYGDHRIYLHCIHPCSVEEALFHPHPWPSAMRIVGGTYEMGVGYSSTNEPPPIAAKIILPTGSEYEMTNTDGWHYVRPVDGVCYTIMVTGMPWKRESPKSTKPLLPLSAKRKTELIEYFREL